VGLLQMKAVFGVQQLQLEGFSSSILSMMKLELQVAQLQPDKSPGRASKPSIVIAQVKWTTVHSI